VVLLKAIGANWLVCIAVWSSMAAQDVAGKMIAMWPPVCAFVTLGFEHCIANMFTLTLGLMEGAGPTFGSFLFNNLLPATIGNFAAGAFCVGFLQWYVHSRTTINPVDALAPADKHSKHAHATSLAAPAAPSVALMASSSFSSSSSDYGDDSHHDGGVDSLNAADRDYMLDNDDTGTPAPQPHLTQPAEHHPEGS